MTRDEIVRRAFEAFGADAERAPPLTLRGGNAVDGYDEAEPFDAERDAPTDAYIEGFAFWGIAYLDAQSWRHYLPRLIEYAFRRPDDPTMAVEALVRSLRPPDRYPPRLATLTGDQEAVIVAFLEELALGGHPEGQQEDAQQALEEWWLAGARQRPDAAQIAALRSMPVAYHTVGTGVARVSLPTTLAGTGTRDIPEESRTVEGWHGVICGDVPVAVAINVTPLADRHLGDIVKRTTAGMRAARVEARPVRVPGADRSERFDGLSRGDSPAEPQRITLVFAVRHRQVATLTIRTWPRDDVEREIDRIARSFEIVAPEPAPDRGYG